ncbi:cupin domain-containing protein [Patescibacteria group bacterium]
MGLNHNPDIKKRVIIEKGYIPQLMIFGQATFKQGQIVEEHKHNTMFEVFYIQSGKADFIVNGKKVVVNKGETITLEPKELHSQSNPYSKPVTWLYFGIAID